VLSPVAVDLVRRPAGYLLDVDRECVDLHQFRGLAARARIAGSDEERAALLGKAVMLWRGTPPMGRGQHGHHGM
jgi:hypothetical protein